MVAESFEERIERAAAEWQARYGVDEEVGWTDAQLDQALADHGFPPLASLPSEAQGMMKQLDSAAIHSPDVTPEERAYRWRRTNASHLLAHAMVHGGERCPGCASW